LWEFNEVFEFGDKKGVVRGVEGEEKIWEVYEVEVLN